MAALEVRVGFLVLTFPQLYDVWFSFVISPVASG